MKIESFNLKEPIKAIHFDQTRIDEIIPILKSALFSEQREGIGASGWFVWQYNGKSHLLKFDDYIICLDNGTFECMSGHEFRNRYEVNTCKVTSK